MIATDTSSLVAFLEGETGSDVNALRKAIGTQILVLPPIVLTEILSDPGLAKSTRSLLLAIPMLEIESGLWSRAGMNRSKLVKKRLKCRVADAVIAQICIDANIPLITRDSDFRHFEKHCGLTIIW